jgi:2-polyprenyl-3-methyl-5-hydroxy-6-metoxy-1,4-benzoquinol methylase
VSINETPARTWNGSRHRIGDSISKCAFSEQFLLAAISFQQKSFSSHRERNVHFMAQVTENYYKREFWATENLRYVQPHFRLAKAARIVNRLARDKECELLDVGCGPGTLSGLLNKNIDYYGIDIAIHHPAPNLLQTDFLAGPIQFGARQFDIIIAQGVFEYVGTFQAQKLAEIKQLLRNRGIFIVSYVNFDHLHCRVYEPYSNVQPFEEFRKHLARVFHINRCFPTSYHWYHREPNREWLKAIQMRINLKIPLLSQLFAVEYFFICSSDGSGRE